ncbi:MAG: hypothetical protein J6X97_01760 [Lachnospiraceae bacterium]|nr:hypothetical protein [Lachnospiraceae bacterium]
MNVKTYLKGIGVGIIVASLILIIAGNMNKGMSDADVIKKAKELGMVEASAVNQSTETVAVNVEETKESAEADSKDKSAEPVKAETTEDKATADNTAVENNTTEENAANTSEDTKPDDTIVSDDNAETNVTDNTTDTSPDNVSGETVKVEVRSGMSSESVSLAVKNAGLVESDAEFNKYLCENGYDKKLRVGSFDIPSGSDFETIAKYLCGIK